MRARPAVCCPIVVGLSGTSVLRVEECALLRSHLAADYRNTDNHCRFDGLAGEAQRAPLL